MIALSIMVAIVLLIAFIVVLAAGDICEDGVDATLISLGFTMFLFLAIFAGYEAGQKEGQKDALRGKFHYEMTFEVDKEGNVIDTNFVEID